MPATQIYRYAFKIILSSLFSILFGLRRELYKNIATDMRKTYKTKESLLWLQLSSLARVQKRANTPELSQINTLI